MNKSFWGVFVVMLGTTSIILIALFQSITNSDEHNSQLLKEVTEAAMLDAVDWAHYRKYGEVRIIKEKFVEVFVRRFSETVNINKTYNLKFYDIYEAPPKVSVKVTTVTDSYNIMGDANTNLQVINKIDSVLEVKKNSKQSSSDTSN